MKQINNQLFMQTDKTMTQYIITFWDQPTIRRYESLIRDSISHVGRRAAFCAILDFVESCNDGVVHIDHDNIHIELDIDRDLITITEYPKGKDLDGSIKDPDIHTGKLSNWYCIHDLAIAIENTYRYQ